MTLRQVWNDVKSKLIVAHSSADLDKALVLEPTNESVKNEILELEKLSQQQKLKQRSKYIVGLYPCTDVGEHWTLVGRQLTRLKPSPQNDVEFPSR